MYTVDDIEYENFEEIPELGSWKCTKKESGNVRTYNGLAADVSKLPTVANYPKYKNVLGNSSTAYCIDTGDLYMYELSSDTWYKQ